MTADLPAIVLILGVTVVPWLLWAFARGRRTPGDVDIEPEWVATGAQEPEDAIRTLAMIQIRPDGVVLDWRDESSMARPQGMSVRTVTDTTAPLSGDTVILPTAQPRTP